MLARTISRNSVTAARAVVPSIARYLATKRVPMDGNTAAAHVAYAMSDAALIFPITPSSPMAESCDQWVTQGRKNVFGNKLRVVEMQSEAGAAGALHGAITAGALGTTFTSSQGLLLMYPNMFKIAGECLPGVIHVAARAVAGQALSIYGDHNDVMAVRPSGFCMLASNTVQEAMDMAAISHASSIEASLPFAHFFDGFRVSHEIAAIEPIDYALLGKLYNPEKLKKFRMNALNPEAPKMRGTAQSPDVYFQICEAANKVYDAVPEVVEKTMNKFAALTGRQYKLYEYSGAADAEHVVVVMGSGAIPIKQATDYLVAHGKKVGMVDIRLFNPFDVKKFTAALPATVKKITILDRTREAGAVGDPLFLNVVGALKGKPLQFFGGRYGLGSKEFTPGMAMAVFANAEKSAPKESFTVGINDDVTNKSLEYTEFDGEVLPKGTKECMFWGLGADGTVGANKMAIKMICDAGMFGQGYFSYSAHKSGGLTCSHLRFGPEKFDAPYLITHADFVACHQKSYIKKYLNSMLEPLKVGGTFLLNAPWKTQEELEANIPAMMRRVLAQKKIRVFTVDAATIARKVGLGNRINLIMQTAFFHLSQILDPKVAINLLKKGAEKDFKKKGMDVVKRNWDGIDNAVSNVFEIKYDTEKWAKDTDSFVPRKWGADGSLEQDAIRPAALMAGDNVPVSKFIMGGELPLGLSKLEKRGIADSVPVWNPALCTQCNNCSFVCPHAAIRPFLVDSKLGEDKAAPKGTPMIKATGIKKAKGSESLKFAIGVSQYDCLGCTLCAKACPEDGALVMKPFALDSEEALAKQAEFNYLVDLPDRSEIFDGVKGLEGGLKATMFKKPLLEFNGACAGCQEAAIVRLITQLYGPQMMVANATGCTSIWAGSFPMTPYTTNKRGHGPAWANSLFEDNAEFGLGMNVGTELKRAEMRNYLVELTKSSECTVPEFKALVDEYLATYDDTIANGKVVDKLRQFVSGIDHPLLNKVKENMRFLSKKSQWIFGGDGWAYDIGYGGLDHVLASGEDVNVLVVDTEVYSNTGGQASKSTQRSGVAKFASEGKNTSKKDLAAMAMQYGNVYVASVAMGADKRQLLKALKEAESYKGPSLIISYSPCIEQGLKPGMEVANERQALAVKSGYHMLFRYDPRLAKEGKNPLQLDAVPDVKLLPEFIKGEARFTGLNLVSKEIAKAKQSGMMADIEAKVARYIKLAGQQ